MKALLVIDESVFPSRNGSGAVYRAWLAALREHAGDVALLIFSRSDAYGGNDQQALSSEISEFLVVPAEHPHISMKLLRSFGRSLTGGLFAPVWVERLGRGEQLAAVREFIVRVDPDVIVVQKLSCSVLLDGAHDAARAEAVWMLDIHDDFVTREALERRVLGELLTADANFEQIPALRKQQTRHRITRFLPAQANRQEARLLRQFDVVCVASDDEAVKYEALFADAASGGTRVKRINWGFSVKAETAQTQASYHAGIIASDAPFNLEGILHFIRGVLPQVQAQRPDFRLLVAGSSATALQAAGFAFPGVSFQSWIEDLSDYYEDVQIALVPLCHGTGVSIKTVEAVSYGAPVVTTVAGVRGLQRLAQGLGKDVCRSDAEFAAGILCKLQDFETAKSKAVALRETLGSHYSYENFSLCISTLLMAGGSNFADNI